MRASLTWCGSLREFVEKILNVDLKGCGDPHQRGRAYPVGTQLIFLNLLKRDAESLAKLFFGLPWVPSSSDVPVTSRRNVCRAMWGTGQFAWRLAWLSCFYSKITPFAFVPAGPLQAHRRPSGFCRWPRCTAALTPAGPASSSFPAPARSPCRPRASRSAELSFPVFG
jgi:hypothetical protein